MALKDVAGVFSAYFVVGFFAPAFFAIVAVVQVLDVSSISDDYDQAGAAAQLLVQGGIALLLALVLSGLHYPVLRLFEGYPLKRFRDVEPFAWLYRAMVGRWEKRYDKLESVRRQSQPSKQRTAAAQQLARYFPDRQGLMPTRFGNAIRSFERHPRERYGLDGVTIWPRVELLLSDQERQVVSQGETDVAFFVNTTLLLPVVGTVLFVDAIVDGRLNASWWAALALLFFAAWPFLNAMPLLGGVVAAVGLDALANDGLGGLGTPLWLVYVLPFVGAWGTYRAAVGAALRWGSPVRAAFDLHRIELYRRLGVKLPMGPSEETDTARFVNRMLLYGEPIPPELRTSGGEEGNEK
jgi:hypothetical protein